MRLLTPFMIAATLSATLAACTTEPRFGTPTPVPDTRVSSRYLAIEIVQATLPTYGAEEQIYVRDKDGGIAALGPLWADDPARSVTLQLARDLGQITGAIAAPAPWPFRDLADVRVDVRIEDFLATAEGSFLLSGQFYVAPEMGGRSRARRFAYSEPVGDAGSAAAIAAARGAALTRLAVDIAQNGLR
ncbi:MAG: hypothetical protein CML68_06040 [Rhodobacteraceae bacterium]|nr:hypothetical protein [Paracoccaceae bacterium]